jgi:hypothetical protein
MANEIQTKFDAYTAITISLTALAAAAGRSSLLIGNANRRPAAMINLCISPNTAPTAGTTYDLFLLRTNGTANQGTDLWGETDAAFTPVNAQLIGSLVNPGTTTDVEDIFDTAPLGPLGGDWGIAVRNSTNVSIDATEGNHIKQHAMYLPEIQ